MFYSSLTALIIHPFYISFLFLRKTLMARNGQETTQSINRCIGASATRCNYRLAIFDVRQLITVFCSVFCSLIQWRG